MRAGWGRQKDKIKGKQTETKSSKDNYINK